ncbi:porin [Castellaniella sp.]|uniref:porin n=1 Tax=Castellaniella sp. TaxID=1955812 RepID=UPI002AFF4E7B|nr:porin [Castellaniella sp.]
MKKTLLAAALLAGFATAGVAQAETSVTLYGILDTGYGYSQYKYSHTDAAGNSYNAKATSSGIRDGFLSGNRFGLKGSEDLGDGLRAIFVLEQGFNIGTAKPADKDRQFNRQAFVGLASDSWGTFTMGRQYNFGDGYHDASFGSSFGDTDKAFGAKSVRVDQMFKYETPNFAGFQAGIGYGTNGQSAVKRASFNGVANTAVAGDDRANYLTVGLKYANGPIFAGATYDRQGSSGQDQFAYDPTNVNANALGLVGSHYNVTNWMISGGYDFEVVKLGLGYGQDRNGKLNGMAG